MRKTKRTTNSSKNAVARELPADLRNQKTKVWLGTDTTKSHHSNKVSDNDNNIAIPTEPKVEYQKIHKKLQPSIIPSNFVNLNHVPCVPNYMRRNPSPKPRILKSKLCEEDKVKNSTTVGRYDYISDSSSEEEEAAQTAHDRLTAPIFQAQLFLRSTAEQGKSNITKMQTVMSELRVAYRIPSPVGNKVASTGFVQTQSSSLDLTGLGVGVEAAVNEMSSKELLSGFESRKISDVIEQEDDDEFGSSSKNIFPKAIPVSERPSLTFGEFTKKFLANKSKRSEEFSNPNLEGLSLFSKRPEKSRSDASFTPITQQSSTRLISETSKESTQSMIELSTIKRPN